MSIRFNYRDEFEDWAIENKYDPDDFHSQETLLEKSYSKIIEFYIKHDTGTFAKVHAYHATDEGLFDITVEAEGLTRKVEKVVVEKVSYVYPA